MNCRKFNKSLPDWVSGRLSVSMIQEMEDHRGTCPQCRAAAEEERGLFQAFRSLPEPSRSIDVRHLLASRIAEAPRGWMPAFPRRWALAGTLAAGVLCGIILLQHPFSGRAGQIPPTDEDRIVAVVASMRQAADPDSDYTIDLAHHVPSRQRAVLVGAEK